VKSREEIARNFIAMGSVGREFINVKRKRKRKRKRREREEKGKRKRREERERERELNCKFNLKLGSWSCLCCKRS